MQIIELNFIQNIYFLLFLYYIFYNNILAQIRSYVIYRYYEGEFSHFTILHFSNLNNTLSIKFTNPHRWCFLSRRYWLMGKAYIS